MHIDYIFLKRVVTWNFVTNYNLIKVSSST